MLTAALTNPAVWLVLVILAFACILYAWRIVRPMRHGDPQHGQTAWLVVVGVSLTGFAYAVILALVSGVLVSLEHAALLLLAFVAAGAPMIIEYVQDHLDHSQRQRARDIISRIGQLTDEE